MVLVQEDMLRDTKVSGDVSRESHARLRLRLQGVEMLSREELVLVIGADDLRQGHNRWVRS